LILLLRESGFEDLRLTNPGKDEGIDGIGIVKVNPFVTFKVLFQCKRYAEKLIDLIVVLNKKY